MDTNNSLANISEQLAASVEKASRSIVAIDARPRVPTSGIVWRNGVIVSTNHTIRRDEDITIQLQNGARHAVTLVGRDAGTDLAVLKISDEAAGQSLQPVEIGDAANLKVGNIVLAVGCTDAERGARASFGIVNSVAGAWRTWRGDEIDRFISLDVAIYIGFSGGALVDAEGKVYGVNTSAFGRGTALTIPASTVSRVVETLLTRGKVARPYLGIGAQQRIPLSQNLRDKLNLQQATGLMILIVEPGDPAEKAGIFIGDVLLRLEGKETTDIVDIQTILAEREPGSPVKADLLRGGELKTVEITLGERPVRSERRHRRRR
jgi:S1-C subfamily serine protease